MMDIKPKVSVRIITYNHEKFIAKAIESVLEQECDFPYEIVVGEDCSTDNTRNIVLDFQKRYPDKIKLFLPDENLGARANNLEVLNICKGEYIAFLDGDDYWSSPDKLQKQVNLLDSCKNYSACFHRVEIVAVGQEKKFLYPSHKLKPFMGVRDLLKENCIPTSSVIYRNTFSHKFPNGFEKIPFGDWPRYILSAQKGPIGFIDEVMAVHVLHAGCMWGNCFADQLNKSIKHEESNIVFYNIIKEYLGKEFESIIDSFIIRSKVLIAGNKFKKLFPTFYSMYHRLKYGVALNKEKL